MRLICAAAYRSLTGPILGGLLANPTYLYPSIFPRNSIWAEHPYLLPNLAISLLQLVTFIVALLVLKETHPSIPARGLSVRRILKKFFARRGRTKNTTYFPFTRASTGPETRQNIPEQYQFEDFRRERDRVRNSSDVGRFDRDEPATKPPSRVFTTQVILQIVAVSLFAFHKAASDSLMTTLLALGPVGSGTSVGEPAPRGVPFPHVRTGFGYSSIDIGAVFFMEAFLRMLIQPAAIHWFISKLGARRALRCVFLLYPAMYILTPFIPRVTLPHELNLLLLDMGIKMGLLSVGYICSAVL